MNTLFGLRPWKPHVTKRPLEERSPEVKTLYIEPTTVKADVGMFNNVFVTLTFWLIKQSKIIFLIFLWYNRFLSYFLECDVDTFVWLVALSHLYCNCISSRSHNIRNSLCEMVLATQIILFLAFWKVYCSFDFGTDHFTEVTSMNQNISFQN